MPIEAPDVPRLRHDLWLADITGYRTAEGKLYVCAIEDGHDAAMEPFFSLLQKNVLDRPTDTQAA